MENWMVMMGDSAKPAINGGMVRRQGLIDRSSVIAYVSTIGVDDFESSMVKVTSAGGKVVVPKKDVGDVGLLANAKAKERNTLERGMTCNRPKPKS